MHYTTGITALGAFGAASAMPDDDFLFLLARILLDGAGLLFGVYLVIGVVVSIAGSLMRRRDSRIPREPEQVPRW